MTSSRSYSYEGSELELFSHAGNWKRYWSSLAAPFVRGRVLDVGAGLGATLRLFANSSSQSWTALEPDATLAEGLREAVNGGELPRNTRVMRGVTQDLVAEHRFETVLYIDVLEHIEDDADELKRAMSMLVPGGHLIVLVPAHQWLYSPFDKAVGHWRRYSAHGLHGIVPEGLEVLRLSYLDSVGLLASLGNRLLLRSASPTREQIALWDKVLVPCSRLLDRAAFGKLGKSILLVARR